MPVARRSITKYLISGIVLVAIGMANYVRIVDEQRQTERQTEERRRNEAEQTRFANMTPAQHFENAQLALRPDATLSAISEGLRNLKAIPPSAPESAKSKALEQKLTRALNLARVQAVAEAEKKRLAMLTPLEVASEKTKIVNFTWQKGGFDAVMLASFTIRNDSPHDVKDLRIRCEHSADSGTVIDSNTETVYQVIKAHTTRTFRNVNMGFIASQAARSGCEILSLKLASQP